MTKAEYIEKNNIRTIVDPSLPHSVNGFCYHDLDGNEFFVVSDRLDPFRRRETADHELRHLQRGEMYDTNYQEY